MTTIYVNRKLSEAGLTYERGDEFDESSVAYDRLVFLLAREWVMPSGGFPELDDDLFTDVMEARD